MEYYKNNKKLDYIAITLKKYDDSIFGTEKKRLERSPNKNYNVAYYTDNDALVMMSTKDSRVGTHVICSGNCLNILRGEGHGDMELSEYIMSLRCNITRVDIAVTSEFTGTGWHELLPHDIARMAMDGKLESRLKPDNHVASPELKIDTAYIGSRKSRNRIFRSYDKGLELDLEKYKIIRYELETRKNAKSIVNAVASGLDIGGIIRRYVDFPSCDLWRDIMNSDSVEIPHIESSLTQDEKDFIERSNRWHWLMTSVAPAMAKALTADNVEPNDNENLRLFNLRVSQIMEDLKNE